MTQTHRRAAAGGSATAASAARRTRLQIAADRAAADLATRLGRTVRGGRGDLALDQDEVAGRAGVSQSTVSLTETGGGAGTPLRTWMRLAFAVDSELRAYLERLPGAERPRDAVHLRHQELVTRVATTGGWRVRAEAMLDAGSERSRAADLLLERGGEIAIFEIWDWFDDVGAAFRSWDRKLARVDELTGTEGGVAGCWVVRSTRRNRALVADHRTLFRVRFPGSAQAWLDALASPERAAPESPGLVWVSVGGDRLYGARLG